MTVGLAIPTQLGSTPALKINMMGECENFTPWPQLCYVPPALLRMLLFQLWFRSDEQFSLVKVNFGSWNPPSYQRQVFSRRAGPQPQR